MPSNNHLSFLRRTYTKLFILFCFLVVTVFSSQAVLFGGQTASATDSASASTDVTLNLGSAMYIRVLDSTATSEISELSFDFTPTAAGVSSTKSAVVEVGTSNETGYTLYMESSYQNASSAYTTNLTNLDADISDYIPTSVPANPSSPASSAYPFWYYYNPYAPLVNGVATVVGNSVIPTHSNPDIIAKNSTAIDKVDTTVPFTIGVNSAIAAGTYANQLTFTAVGNALPVSYTLNYNANTDGAGGDDGSVSNLPSTQSERIVQGTYTFTIPSTAPTRSNYAFAGYSTDPATDPTSSTATIYQPGDTITLTSGSSYSVEETLYALWRSEVTYTLAFDCNSGVDCPATQSATTTDATKSFTIPSTIPNRTKGYVFTQYSDGSGNYYNPGDTVNLTASNNTITLTAQWELASFWTITNMQEMTAEVCNSVYTPSNATGDAVTLVSDPNDYNVVSDGQPYVAQRSLYDIRGKDGSGTSANPVSPSSSNALSYTIRKLADGNCWMSEELYLPLTVGTGVEASYNDGSTFTYTPTTTGINANTKTYTWNGTDRWYYSWYAATAEKGTSSSTGDIDGSICPKGWKLPYNYTISSTLSWGALTNAYGVTVNGANTSTTTGYLVLQASPLSLPLAGYYYNGSYNYGGSYGGFWSSTAITTSAYYLYFYSTSVYPQNNHSKSALGFNVRCVASPLVR